MSTFQLSAFPCEVQPGGTVQIVITSCLKRETVECDYSEVAEKMGDFGRQMIAEHGAAHPQIHVSADIQSRMVKGWKAIVAAGKDERVFTKEGVA